MAGMKLLHLAVVCPQRETSRSANVGDRRVREVIDSFESLCGAPRLLAAQLAADVKAVICFTMSEATGDGRECTAPTLRSVRERTG